MTPRRALIAQMAATIALAASDHGATGEVKASEEPPITRQQRRALERAGMGILHHTISLPHDLHEHWPEKDHERRNTHSSNPKKGRR